MKVTKEEIIDAAYGDNLEKVKPYLRYEDGSIPLFIYTEDGDDMNDFFYKELGYNREEINPHVGGDMEVSRWRLKSLDGIEDNNGWTKIEPDGSNLPPLQPYNTIDTPTLYKVIDTQGNKVKYWIYEGMKQYWINHFTHYKEIDKDPFY